MKLTNKVAVALEEKLSEYLLSKVTKLQLAVNIVRDLRRTYNPNGLRIKMKMTENHPPPRQ